MEKLTIELTYDDGKYGLKTLCNDIPIPNLASFEVGFDRKDGQMKALGKRLALDKAGQFYVDTKTKDTALEDVNLLFYLSKDFRIHEQVQHCLMQLEFIMKNIHDTSFYNTWKLFDEYGV